MKLTTVTNVSLDGVTQGHREIAVGSGHDSGGFERFRWVRRSWTTWPRRRRGSLRSHLNPRPVA
jgi:hypothetical protein